MNVLKENFSVTMIRPDLENIPQFELPRETKENKDIKYFFQWYQPGDEKDWVRINDLADEYNNITPKTFRDSFGKDVEEMKKRICFLSIKVSRKASQEM